MGQFGQSEFDTQEFNQGAVSPPSPAGARGPRSADPERPLIDAGRTPPYHRAPSRAESLRALRLGRMKRGGFGGSLPSGGPRISTGRFAGRGGFGGVRKMEAPHAV